jgi:hypothetical protein
LCTNDSHWAVVSRGGSWSWNYFQENGRSIGLSIEMRWHFGFAMRGSCREAQNAGKTEVAMKGLRPEGNEVRWQERDERRLH